MIIEDVKVKDVRTIIEANGSLSFMETPFDVKRIFYVYNVRVGDIRGFHAHKKCKQLLIAMSGTVTVTCDDGENRKSFNLTKSSQGLYIPPMIWSEQFYHTSEAVLLGLASHEFDESDYIRNYEEYKKQI